MQVQVHSNAIELNWIKKTVHGGVNILCLCEEIHVATLGLCHKVSRLTWWNLGGSEWKLSGRNWCECLISVITCYYDANLQFTREYMGKTAYIRPNYCKVRAKERFWSCFWGKKVLILEPKTLWKKYKKYSIFTPATTRNFSNRYNKSFKPK